MSGWVKAWVITAGMTARADWRGCVELPPETTGNDVAFGPDGGLIAPSYQPTTQGFSGAYWTVRGGLGGATGEVMQWRPGAGWSRLPESRATLPNGVLHSANDGLVFVAETGSGRIAILDTRRDPSATAERRKIEIGGYPDNLAWSREGRVLAITHRAGVGVLLCKLGRLPCRTGWSLFEIDPASLAPRERLRHDGSAVGAASSVAEARGRFYFGAVFDDRIGVWRPGA